MGWRWKSGSVCSGICRLDQGTCGGSGFSVPVHFTEDTSHWLLRGGGTQNGGTEGILDVRHTSLGGSWMSPDQGPGSGKSLKPRCVPWTGIGPGPSGPRADAPPTEPNGPAGARGLLAAGGPDVRAGRPWGRSCTLSLQTDRTSRGHTPRSWNLGRAPSRQALSHSPPSLRVPDSRASCHLLSRGRGYLAPCPLTQRSRTRRGAGGDVAHRGPGAGRQPQATPWAGRFQGPPFRQWHRRQVTMDSGLCPPEADGTQLSHHRFLVPEARGGEPTASTEPLASPQSPVGAVLCP